MVIGYKTAVYIGRSADMALTTAGMAGAAVPVKGPIDGLYVFGIVSGSPSRQRRSHGCDGIMQAVGCRGHDGFVAICTRLRRIGKSGVFDHISMRRLPIDFFRVTAVALLAGDLTVFGLQK